MNIREILDQHGTIVATGSAAVLSFLTGILQIGTPVAAGPFGFVIPFWLQEVAGFTGVLTGFLLAASTVYLWRGYRVGWYAAVILVPLAGLQGVLQSSTVSIPLILLSLVSLIALFWNRNRFQQPTALSPTQIAALSAVIGAQVYGTVGAYALRQEFNQHLSIIDAAYYAIVTASTVGYGDIHPVTDAARLFTISLVFIGTGSFAAFIGAFAGPLIEKHLGQRVSRRQQKSAIKGQ